MGTFTAPDFTLRVRTKDEARRTVHESDLIDRGFLPNRFTLVVIVVALGLCVIAAAWSLVPIALLALDYAWFAVRRRRVLKRYEAGTPRLKTPADFEAVGEAFKREGLSEPTMTEWHEAAGFGGAPQWREDLRYRIAASHYRGGTLLDAGCGDGRLCWRYHACDAAQYIGVDVTRGLLAEVSSRTQGKARTVLAVAEAFEHLPEPQAALAEFNRVLKPHGQIVIQSPNALRMRNFNPFHVLSLIVGYWWPTVLLRKIVHPNTFVEAFTYHWDFTRQDIAAYAQGCPGLSVRSVKGATYHFNPGGSLPQRMCARFFRFPVIHWLGWDLTVVLQKQGAAS